VISEKADTLAGWVTASCGRGRASYGAAQAIITNAAARMTRPAAPVSHVAFARSLLTTAVISPPRFPALPAVLTMPDRAMSVSHMADTFSVSLPTLIAAGTGPRRITGGRPELCRLAGAKEALIPRWTEEGRRRAAIARRPPFCGGLRPSLHGRARQLDEPGRLGSDQAGLPGNDRAGPGGPALSIGPGLA
jgi:hypothetical protein